MRARVLALTRIALGCAAVALSVCGVRAATQSQREGDAGTEGTGERLVMWYDRPAMAQDAAWPPAKAETWRNDPAWLRALPIGNGRLGAMVFGGVSRERLQLNEDSVWSGWAEPGDNPGAPAALAEIRRLLFAGEYGAAQELTKKAFVCVGNGSGYGEGNKVAFGSYQTLGDLLLEFPGVNEATEYRRELDLRRGVVTTKFVSGGTRHTREVFASHPDGVIVMRLTADRPGAVSFSARLTRSENTEVRGEGNTMLVMRGGTAPRTNPGAQGAGVGEASEGRGGVRFAAALGLRAENGESEVAGDGITVRGADAATLVIGARTDYWTRRAMAGGGSRGVASSEEVERDATNDVRGAIVKEYGELVRAHERDYRGLFDRVSIRLGKHDAALEALPTDVRLARVRKAVESGSGDDADRGGAGGIANRDEEQGGGVRGGGDPGLAALYYQFGRYLLISSSRPGDLPANLQGLWADGIQTPWSADYHTNINLQMNYWGAEAGALGECVEPLVDFVESLRKPGRETARVHYGATGWVVHHITNVWGFTAPAEDPSWGQFPAGAAWLCLHLWERALYTGDERTLRRVLPTMIEAADFYLSFLVAEPGTGYLVTAPSSSPENSFRTAQGGTAQICAGPSMDTQIIRELFAACVSGCEQTGEYADRAAALRSALERLAPARIGRFGQLMEWLHDVEEAEPGHRHMSHLFALHPGTQIDPIRTPDLAQAARRTLDRRLMHGGGHTGWSRAWMVNFYARLHDGEEALGHLEKLLSACTADNMFDIHPPFQIDGNFGGGAAIMEMLIQSHGGELVLLAALPRAWSEGAVRGVRARGGLTVDFDWRDGRCTGARIATSMPTPVRVRCGTGQRVTLVSFGGIPVEWRANPDGSGEYVALPGVIATVDFE